MSWVVSSCDPTLLVCTRSTYNFGSGDVGGGNGDFLTAFDRRTGHRIQDLLHFPEKATVQLAGYSRQADGTIIYAARQQPEGKHARETAADQRDELEVFIPQ